MLETTALGAAIAAGFAIGVWDTFDELKNINKAGKTEFHPKITKEESKEKFSRWSKAVEMCKGWLWMRHFEKLQESKRKILQLPGASMVVHIPRT